MGSRDETLIVQVLCAGVLVSAPDDQLSGAEVTPERATAMQSA
jgi:hypothetical protein